MTQRIFVGNRYIYRCRECGTLCTATVESDSFYDPPIDVQKHEEQRGAGHEVIASKEPMFVDGQGPTFAIGSRVVFDFDLRHGLAATVLGTLLDFDGKEYVGFVNDIGNSHLELAERLMTLEPSGGNHLRLFDPHLDRHYSIDRDQPGWLATIREYPMMWVAGHSMNETLEELIKTVNHAVNYEQENPTDRGQTHIP